MNFCNFAKFFAELDCQLRTYSRTPPATGFCATTEREIFISALEPQNGADLSAFLDQACAGDVDLRERVEGLLREHGGLGSFLEAPAGGLVSPITQPPVGECPGTIIGPYKLLEQIGEGGFGIVFMAEQQLPVRRKVAVKVLKPGMDTKQVIARFEAERQALALMDHPHIAKVFDAGQTASGRPTSSAQRRPRRRC